MTGDTPKTSLVLDLDTGIDDALALILAARSPAAELVAIGTVAGNIGVEQTTTNTLTVLDVLNVDAPVAVGLSRPLLRPPNPAPHVHGADGLGEASLPPPQGRPTGEHAADQLVRLAHERPGALTLVACGPLTNVAAALIREPELPHLIKELVVMGGAAGAPGNVTPVAEANIYNDPEAARLVFDADWPLTMVGLDVTMTTRLRAPEFARLRAADTPVARFVSRIVAFYARFYSGLLGYEACVMHDPLALGIALDPTLVTHMADLDVRVETEGDLTLGMTVADRRPLLGPGFARPRRPVHVPLTVDSPRFVEQLMWACLA